MKKLTIAFLYNVRHKYPDLNNPQTQLEADFDDPETTKLQISYLKKLGYRVIPIEADENAYIKLNRMKNKIDLAFNMSEGIFGKDREAQIPAMLEMLQIPYTGSSPLTQALVLNKAKTKEILMANDIPTLPFQIMSTTDITLKKMLKFPLIVKPVSEGSSAGITNNSVVRNRKELKKQVFFIEKTFHQESIVEPYLSGREFSVAMLGNPPRILPIIESDHSVLPKKFLPLDSLEVKWFYEIETSGKHLICPANLRKNLLNKLHSISYNTWNVMQIRDWCRIDIRCDEYENPYVLEINSPPGCTPPEHDPASYFPLMAGKTGISYEDLLQKIIQTALRRYHK